MAKPEPKTAAILTIIRADAMTCTGRRRVAAWLRRQAWYVEKFGGGYGKRTVVRYRYKGKTP